MDLLSKEDPSKYKYKAVIIINIKANTNTRPSNHQKATQAQIKINIKANTNTRPSNHQDHVLRDEPNNTGFLEVLTHPTIS